MNIEFKCPQCGQMVEADESACGQVAECPHCGKGIVVPRNRTKLEVRQERPSGVSTRKPSIPITSRHEFPSSFNTTRVKCPHCGTEYNAGERDLHKTTICGECGKEFIAGSIEGYAPRKVDFTKFFSFTGRARRSEYWRTVLCTAVPALLLLMTLWLIALVWLLPTFYNHYGTTGYSSTMLFMILISIPLVLAAIILPIPVTVRRLHDRNMPGWWLLVFRFGGFIPFVGSLVNLAEFIIVGCMDGTPGKNDYGDDPKGRQTIQSNGKGILSFAKPADSPEERLLKLLKLKEAGVLSDEEYEKRRVKLVASLDL